MGKGVLREKEAHDINSIARFLLASKKSCYSISDKLFFYQKVIGTALSNTFGLLREIQQLWWLSTIFCSPTKLISRENDSEYCLSLG